MKKIYVLFLLLIAPASMAAVLMQKTPAPKAPVINNSVLHVQEGIKGNQNSIHNLYFPGTIKPMKPQNPPQQQITPLPPGHKPPFHPPVMMYGYERVNTAPSAPVVINNTYIYQNPPVEEAGQAPVNENVKSQLQIDEEERQALRKKYSSVLSNKTMSNEKMCKNMSVYFPNADYDELDRVLNNILRLNCDINKLR